MRYFLLFTFSVFLVVSSGCAWFETEKEKTAQELLDEGTEYFEDERFKKAIESFDKLRDWYPFSKYAVIAELKIADAHYHIEEYDEAVFAYKEFEELHPTNEKTPYAVFQTGRCYFVQIDTVDRDQSTAQRALDSFSRLLNNYPDSYYVPQSKENIKKCQQSLSGHELYVGEFYFKTGHYKAALNRFNNVIREYPDVGFHKKAFKYIPLCKVEIEKEAALEKENLEETQKEEYQND